jgi:predicted ATPase/transcriptional regulator with XRE-family HTH domain
MPSISSSAISFGALLKQLRRRAGLTQGDLAARVGYSVAQISRLEQDERLPTVAAIAELFVPALDLGAEPHLAHRLIELASLARGERPPDAVQVTRVVHTVIDEQVLAPVGHLPAALIVLVGRAQELERISQRLLAAPGRLLTLIGPPGVGKTQVSLAVAARLRSLFRDGVWFVPLASVDDPERVATVIARELALSLTGAKPPEQRLVEHLRRKEVLLVLDNVEQVTDCAPLLVMLLQECAGLRILVTSTDPLRLRIEQRYKVPPLAPAPSVELFIQRAQAVDPEFSVTPATAASITELCLRLDCLPLAIELSAARIDLLTPDAMLLQLQAQRLDLLAHGPRDLEAHHRTLRTALQRSYDLLAANEQSLFRHLGVFVGGFDLAVVATLGFDESTLHSLVSKSLVQRTTGGLTAHRFALLATLRDFAFELLAAAGEAPAAQRGHASYFLELATQASMHWHRPEHQQWLERLEEEHDNLRSAMRWLIEHDGAAAQQLGAALREFWYIRGHYAEARQLLNQALAASATPTTARGHALLAAARFAHAQDENDAAMQLLEASLPILRTSDDLAGYAEALRTGGWIAHSAAQSPRALMMFREALSVSQAIGADALTADLHISIAQIYALDGDEANFAVARRFFEEGLSIARRLKRAASVAYALHGEASLEFMAGDYARSIQLAAEALMIFRQLEFRRNVPLSLLLLGEAALLAGDLITARVHGSAALEHYQELAIPWGIAAAQQLLGQVGWRCGELAPARAWLTASLELSWRLGDRKLTAVNLAALGGMASAQQEHTRAALLLAAASQLFDSLPRFLAPGYRCDYDRVAAATHAALGDEMFAQTWAASQAAGLEQAVALALSLAEHRLLDADRSV